MTTKVERLIRDELRPRWEAVKGLEAVPGSELPRRRVRQGHTPGGALDIGDPEPSIFGGRELVLHSPASRSLAAGRVMSTADAAESREEIALLLTDAGRGHFGVHVDRDGRLNLDPDPDGRRVLALAWEMAGHLIRRGSEPRLCGQCYRPLVAAQRRSMRYCSAKCRAKAAYARKAGQERP